MKTLVILVTVVCTSSALSLDYQFGLFKIHYAKKYDSEDEVHPIFQLLNILKTYKT